MVSLVLVPKLIVGKICESLKNNNVTVRRTYNSEAVFTEFAASGALLTSGFVCLPPSELRNFTLGNVEFYVEKRGRYLVFI